MLFVSNIVKKGKREFLHKFILNKKSRDLFNQFVSVAEREIDIIQGGPIKTIHFLRYHIFAATTCGFCWSVEKFQQKTTSDNFF